MRCGKGPCDAGAGQLRGLSGSDAPKFECPLYPRKLPRLSAVGASSLGQKRTFAGTIAEYRLGSRRHCTLGLNVGRPKEKPQLGAGGLGAGASDLWDKNASRDRRDNGSNGQLVPSVAQKEEATYSMRQAASSGGGTPGFNERTLVFTGPQFAHSKFWSARSRRVGCGSITAGFTGLWHLGQVSSINMATDMASSFRAR
jgi:hypothetical protein